MNSFSDERNSRQLWCVLKPGIVFLVAITSTSPNHLSAQTWYSGLPDVSKESIVWVADHESETMSDWTQPDFRFAGSGIFNTGGDQVSVEATDLVAHSGEWSARTSITNAVRAENGPRAVRLMKWTDRPWDDGGSHLPTEMYYSTWAYFPNVYNSNKYDPWDAGDGGWWNIFSLRATTKTK